MKTLNNWTIELNKGKTELIFSNDSTAVVCYAYYNMETDTLYFDRLIAPKYVQKAAKAYAKLHGMVDVYNDNLWKLAK